MTSSSMLSYVYILRCSDGSLYVGETNNYSESHESRESALKRERQLKRWTRAKKEALIAKDLVRLKQL
jgi:putative endonuclease